MNSLYATISSSCVIKGEVQQGCFIFNEELKTMSAQAWRDNSAETSIHNQEEDGVEFDFQEAIEISILVP